MSAGEERPAASKFGSASEGARPLTGQNEPVGAPDSHAAKRQECQWCGEPVEGRDHHATQWECIGLLRADRDCLGGALTYYAEGRIWDNGEIAREALS